MICFDLFPKRLPLCGEDACGHVSSWASAARYVRIGMKDSETSGRAPRGYSGRTVRNRSSPFLRMSSRILSLAFSLATAFL